jgi:hypothetical protein
MDEKLIKNLLDILPQYINFSIAFLRSPREAFGPYVMKGQVHSDLTSFLFAGVGTAYLFVLVLPFDGFNTQNPHGGVDLFAHWLSVQEPKLLPLHCLMAVLAMVLFCHLSAKLFYIGEYRLAQWSKSDIQPNFPGRAEDSVNAALGFAAVMLPLNVACYGMALLLADSSAVTKFSAFAPFFVVLSTFIVLACVTLFYYFIISFASVHGVGWWRAASALCGAGTILIALFYILT